MVLPCCAAGGFTFLAAGFVTTSAALTMVTPFAAAGLVATSAALTIVTPFAAGGSTGCTTFTATAFTPFTSTAAVLLFLPAAISIDVNYS